MFSLVLLTASVAQPPPIVLERPPVVFLERQQAAPFNATPIIHNLPIFIQPTVTVLPAIYQQQQQPQQYRQPTQTFAPQIVPQYQPQFQMPAPCPPAFTYAPQYSSQVSTQYVPQYRAAPAVAAYPFVQTQAYQPPLAIRNTGAPGADISLHQERGRGLLRPPTRTDLTVTGAQSAEVRGGINGVRPRVSVFGSGCQTGNCPILIR